MKTRDMILSGLIAVVLLSAIVHSSPVMAGETPIEGGPENEKPQVYLLKKTFDICDQYGGEILDSDPLPGGSVPPSGQQYGCVDYLGDRFNEYLFTGEQMAWLVAVRHTNGAEAILDAVLTGGSVDVECNELVYYHFNCDDWFGHNVCDDLNEQPPAKIGQQDNGFDPDFDKLYQCIYTATEDDLDEVTMYVVATDKDGDPGESVPNQVWFNPEIFIDVFTSDGGPIAFGDGASGETVYSINTLKVKNELVDNAGVDVFVWLAGTDLTSSEGPAKCPDTNVLDVDEWMEYRCKIGTIFNNDWEDVPNPNDKEECVISGCQGASPLLPDFEKLSILGAGHTAECWFRLTYPTPCIGLFDQGEILIFARAI